MSELVELLELLQSDKGREWLRHMGEHAHEIVEGGPLAAEQERSKDVPEQEQQEEEPVRELSIEERAAAEGIDLELYREMVESGKR